MKKYLAGLIFLFSFILIATAAAEEYKSIDLLNRNNLASYFNDYLGYFYESHGCLHFSPADIYLLAKTIPRGAVLRIKKYQLEKDDPPFSIEEVPYLVDLTNNPEDIKKHSQVFQSRQIEIVAYPSLQRLFIMVEGIPYAQVKTLPGPPQTLQLAFEVEKGKPIEWDFALATPTDPGKYTILGSTSHYLSNAYYKNTIIPFGAWIIKKDGKWLYQKENRWFSAPPHIISDLNLPLKQQKYNYYDVSINDKGEVLAARFAGHDFGKYVLLWTADGKNKYPEMGYAFGGLLYEQIILVKDLVHILTLPGPDDFDYCISQNLDFTFYKGLYDFIKSKGKNTSSEVPKEMYDYYRLYNNFKTSVSVDPRVLKAFEEYKNNRLPRYKEARYQTLGLYYYLKINSLVIDKQAYWYEKLKKDWSFWRDLRVKLREDFNKMGILSQENRQNILEKWLSDRLEFKIAAPPPQAKNIRELSFTSLFNPDEETVLFNVREKTEMLKLIERAQSQEAESLNLYSVKALNDYNFGRILNDILGDLYKSHGCMHVSPRNAYFLYTLLPRGAEIIIYDYSRKIEDKQLEKIPYLADLVNFSKELDLLKDKFSVTSEVRVSVYPLSGFWVVYLKNKPFAKLQVKGGPQAKMYVVQGRDEGGNPIFEDHLAYPTSTGSFYVFKKVENYVSNIYYDTTVIPMGGRIKRKGSKWIFEKAVPAGRQEKGKWAEVPPALREDLSFPPEKRKYFYYDLVENASHEVVEMKWGSHPFGRYAIQTTMDKKTPFPELIHSSGDLMMEERNLIDDLINILSAPYDDLEKCISKSPNFELYKACYDFARNPMREDLIQALERVSYKLYYGLSLTTEEAKILPPDVIIANKIMRHKGKLTKEETKVLIKEGVAYRRGGELKINMQKILGLQFDTYQYVVMIQKYAHHYETLKKYWNELSGLRQALLKDFNNFVIQDPQVLHHFMRELMLKRTRLEKLSSYEVIEILKKVIEAGAAQN